MDIALKDMILEAGHSPEEADMVTNLLTRKRMYVVMAADGIAPMQGISYFFEKKKAADEVSRLRMLAMHNEQAYAAERLELIRSGRMSNDADHKLIAKYQVKIGRKLVHPANLSLYAFEYAGVDLR